MKKLMTSDRQNRRKTRGNSIKKFDRPSSLVVAHVMFDEKRSA
jgi:hypothetical protein